MKKTSSTTFAKSAVFAALATALYQPTMVLAAEEESVDQGIEKIQVTATRRSATVQEIPVNITALDGDIMKEQNVFSQEDVARWVPGLTISDQGGREGASIIVRGLNTNTSDRDTDGETVARYLGEIAFDADLRLTDINRVEVLIGPQGTLYGAGTLGGAIRYLLNEPVLDETTASVSAEAFGMSQSDDLGSEVGIVFNTPIVEDELAIRLNFNHYDAPGYVDYNYLIKEPGVSNPDPDWSNEQDVANNITSLKDANDEQTTTARIGIKWQPNEEFEADLNYFYQKQENGGNSIVQYQSINSANPLSPLVGQYESAFRFVEPNSKEDTLLSLELKVDLGFAELVSATGYSEYEQEGQRDQTDLLMQDIWTGYADFPAFTNDRDEEESFTQEIRFVSTIDSDISWIVGAYYNKTEQENDSREYTPGITDGLFDGQYINIERDLEYIARERSENQESALFGEIGYQINDKLNLTLGARFYDYEVSSQSAATAPFFDGEIASVDELSFEEVTASDDGSLFKLNASYQFSDDVMAYFTVSEGFRLGGGNGLVACDSPVTLQVCALPNELSYTPDTTTNTELGLKSSWLKNRLHFNASIFSVDWDDAQINAASVNGAEIITLNAGKANSTGYELSVRSSLTDSLIVFANYSYSKAELTEDAPALFRSLPNESSEIQNWYSGADGDRLPGAPEHQASLGVTYNTELMGKSLNINYGLTAQSDVFTKVGNKADGEVLPGYALSNISMTLSDGAWSVTAYVDNLFDKYAYTSVRRDKSWAGGARYQQFNKDLPELGRVYGHYITRPRAVGVRLNYEFEL